MSRWSLRHRRSRRGEEPASRGAARGFLEGELKFVVAVEERPAHQPTGTEAPGEGCRAREDHGGAPPQRLQGRHPQEGRQVQFEGVVKTKAELESRIKAMTEEYVKVLASRQQAFEILEKASPEQGQAKTEEIGRLKEQLKIISPWLLSGGGRGREDGDSQRLGPRRPWPSAEDRVAQLGEEARSLRTTAEAIFVGMWPDETPPARISELAERLIETPAVCERLRESAVRGGAEIALALMLSWYPKGLDDDALDKISGGFRTGTDFQTLRQVKGVRLAASRIGDYVR